MSKKKIGWIVGIVLLGIIGIACSSNTDPAPRNNDTVVTGSAAPAANAVPVTVTGHGESVKTVELVKHGYTVAYSAKSFCIAVAPVKTDGSDGISFINECGSNMDGPVSGTTTYSAGGPVTLHVQNTDGDWTLTFTPLN